jgi:hypothetical protein
VTAAFVAVGAGGFVAVGAAVLVDGFDVAVGCGALLLFAVFEDGFEVAVGAGVPLELAVVVAVDVGDASNSAALSELKLPAES